MTAISIPILSFSRDHVDEQCASMWKVCVHRNRIALGGSQSGAGVVSVSVSRLQSSARKELSFVPRKLMLPQLYPCRETNHSELHGFVTCKGLWE